MIWNNSKMDCLYYSKDEADVGWPCVVKITDEGILIEYDDEGLVQYVGRTSGVGHFELHTSDRKGGATLHQFAGSRLLEGYWKEGGERGMWRIELA